MARLLILFDATSDATLDVAQGIHEGARSVRFAEADLMRLPGGDGVPRAARVREWQDLEMLASYDAIAFGAGPDIVPLVRLLEAAHEQGMRGALANKVGSVFPSSEPAATGTAHPAWPLLAPMARYGMILVPPGYAGPTGAPEDLAAASRRLGKRLIDIAGWIVHARSHHHH